MGDVAMAMTPAPARGSRNGSRIAPRRYSRGARPAKARRVRNSFRSLAGFRPGGIAPPGLFPRSAGAGDLLVEVVPLVVHQDERREVLDLDLPDRLHPELGVFEHLDLPDVLLREQRRRAADRPEVEPAVLLARVGHRPAPALLRDLDEQPP